MMLNPASRSHSPPSTLAAALMLSMYPESDPRIDIVTGTGSAAYPALAAGRQIPVRDGSSSTLVDWAAPADAKCFAGYQPVYNEIPPGAKTFSVWGQFDLGTGGTFTNNPDGSVRVQCATQRALLQTTITLDVGVWAITSQVSDIDAGTDLNKKSLSTSGGTATYSAVGASLAKIQDTNDQRACIVLNVTVAGTVVLRAGAGIDGNCDADYICSQPFAQNVTAFTDKVPGDFVDPDFNEYGVAGLDWLLIENANTIQTTPDSNKIVRGADVDIPSAELYGYYTATDGEAVEVPIANWPLSAGRAQATITYFYDLSTTTSDKPILGDPATARGLLFDSASLNIIGSYDGANTPPAELSIYDQTPHVHTIDYSQALNQLVFDIDGSATAPSDYGQDFPNDATSLHILCSGGIAIKDLQIWDKFGG